MVLVVPRRELLLAAVAAAGTGWRRPVVATELTLRPISAAVAANGGSLGPMALYPDPVLRLRANSVESFGPELARFGELLLDGMTSTAIAASQYGVDARVIALRNESSPDPTAPLLLVNPRVLARSEEERMRPWREICLVLPPDLEVDLLRDEWVEVEAEDVYGRTFRRRLRDEPARAFQHELDHLNGILIVDHAALEELPASIRERERAQHEARQKRAFRRPIEASRQADPLTGARALRPVEPRSRFALEEDLAKM